MSDETKAFVVSYWYRTTESAGILGDVDIDHVDSMLIFAINQEVADVSAMRLVKEKIGHSCRWDVCAKPIKAVESFHARIGGGGLEIAGVSIESSKVIDETESN